MQGACRGLREGGPSSNGHVPRPSPPTCTSSRPSTPTVRKGRHASQRHGTSAGPPKQSGKSDTLLRDMAPQRGHPNSQESQTCFSEIRQLSGACVFPEPSAFCVTQRSKVPKFHPKSPQGSPDSFVNRRYCKFGKIGGTRLPRNGQTRGFVPKCPALTSAKGGPTERAVEARLAWWGQGLSAE